MSALNNDACMQHSKRKKRNSCQSFLCPKSLKEKLSLCKMQVGLPFFLERPSILKILVPAIIRKSDGKMLKKQEKITLALLKIVRLEWPGMTWLCRNVYIPAIIKFANIRKVKSHYIHSSSHTEEG